MNSHFTSRLEKIEAVLRSNLPESPYDGLWRAHSFGKTDAAVDTHHIAELVEPCNILVSSGGKRWRPLFAVLCAEAVSTHDANREELTARTYRVTPLIEFVHTASLIHDDIEDGADMRRGKPAVHISRGIDTALNAGSWLYFQAAACLQDFEPSLKAVLYDTFAMELRRLHLGQAMDICWHKDNGKLPSTKEYLAMTALKTGTLASLSARCGILLGGGSSQQADKTAEAAAAIGVGFQIRDDIINLTSGNVGKKRGDDIVEGKKSLPVLYHLEEHPEDFEKLAACFKQAAEEGIESAAVEKAITLIHTGTALQKASEKSKTLISDACKTIEKLYPGTEGASLIGELFSAM
ncbi:polyprenyl synthetase family protein [Treponema sp. HNW]|uniref:FPP/GGPP synthase family protein n=1 Tax=Treponema sp. HNW TaxID=3116654 RepID=UPI003D136CF7